MKRTRKLKHDNAIPCDGTPRCGCEYHVEKRLAGFNTNGMPPASKPRELPLLPAKEQGGQTTI